MNKCINTKCKKAHFFAEKRSAYLSPEQLRNNKEFSTEDFRKNFLDRFSVEAFVEIQKSGNCVHEC